MYVYVLGKIRITFTGDNFPQYWITIQFNNTHHHRYHALLLIHPWCWQYKSEYHTIISCGTPRKLTKLTQTSETFTWELPAHPPFPLMLVQDPLAIVSYGVQLVHSPLSVTLAGLGATSALATSSQGRPAAGVRMLSFLHLLPFIESPWKSSKELICWAFNVLAVAKELRHEDQLSAFCGGPPPPHPPR